MSFKIFIKKTVVLSAVFLCTLFYMGYSSLYAKEQKNEYDEDGRVTKTVYEDGSYETYTYDENGNLISTQYYKEDVTEGLGDSGEDDVKPNVNQDVGTSVDDTDGKIDDKDVSDNDGDEDLNDGVSDDGKESDSGRDSGGPDGADQNSNQDKTNRKDRTNGADQNQDSNGYDSRNQGNQNREQNDGNIDNGKKTGDNTQLTIIWTLSGLSFLLISVLVVVNVVRKGRSDSRR